MQHYLNCGIGFKANKITPSDWANFSKIKGVDELIHLNTSNQDFQLTIVPPTEDEFYIDVLHHSGSIVLMDSKRMEQMQKNFTFADIEQYKNAYFPLNSSNKEKILVELSKYGLEAYIDEVDVIIYSYCC